MQKIGGMDMHVIGGIFLLLLCWLFKR